MTTKQRARIKAINDAILEIRVGMDRAWEELTKQRARHQALLTQLWGHIPQRKLYGDVDFKPKKKKGTK